MIKELLTQQQAFCFCPNVLAGDRPMPIITMPEASYRGQKTNKHALSVDNRNTTHLPPSSCNAEQAAMSGRWL